MPRQSLIIVAAQIGDGAIEPLKALLETMTIAPGQADPANPIVPFGQIEHLHFARFILLEDPSLPDRASITDLPVKEAMRSLP
ncbi:hypothetical protein [Neorhizobium sp. SHOUNA12B]|uniref:hypothetical protein n=1 Tax=Neorhizobium sp. SHOUNA12B TaxID=2908928 RepID=UPI0025E86469|nr:hypothetical protein [Neorhizobium sp. SHOUNA12B]MCJ9670073.1 hypothetical protein [Neorhizobium sp. SHOUNA12B]